MFSILKMFQIAIMEIALSRRQYDLLKSLGEICRLMPAVIFNMCFTMWGWQFVYGMKVDDKLAAMFRQTDNKVNDAVINGIGAVACLAAVAFGMLALAMFDCQRLVKFWLHASCAMMLFIVSGEFIYESLCACNIDESAVPIATTVITSVYGVVGVMTFFTSYSHQCLHQFYVLTNCALVSLFYLRTFPHYTGWAVLAGMSFWDMFAVLSPVGPLRMVQEKAGDYGEDVLRFLMFNAGDNTSTVPVVEAHVVPDGSNVVDNRAGVPGCTEDDAESEPAERSSRSVSNASVSSHTSDSSSDSDEDDNIVQFTLSDIFWPKTASNSISDGTARTAADALNDNSLRLGMGDFVFYSVLVGTAATNGSPLATIMAAVGIIVGLFITLFYFSNSEHTVPALPISVLLGMFFHFLCLFLDGPAENFEVFEIYAFYIADAIKAHFE